MPTYESRKRPGRRPASNSAGSGAREEIEKVARKQFAELGYERVSVRGIAREAGVDPKLIHHYFGGKEALFAAILEFPIDPREVVSELTRPSDETMGTRLAKIVIGMQQNPIVRLTMLSVIRAATSEQLAAERIRSLLSARLIEPIARELRVDKPQLRASMVASQIVGLLMARHVVKLPPLSAAGDEEVIELLAASLDAVLGVPFSRVEAMTTAGS